jgi:hypothetical protein
MGYSCTIKANNVLDELLIQLQVNNPTNSSNGWNNGEWFYFFEQGQEQQNGAITGTVWKSKTESRYCKKAGSARIEPDGTITRFPTSNKSQRDSAMVTGLIKFHETYGGRWQDDKVLYNLIGDAKFVAI